MGGLSLTFIILGGPGLMGGVSIMMGGAAILRAENHSCAKFLCRTIDLTYPTYIFQIRRPLFAETIRCCFGIVQVFMFCRLFNVGYSHDPANMLSLPMIWLVSL